MKHFKDHPKTQVKSTLFKEDCSSVMVHLQGNVTGKVSDTKKKDAVVLSIKTVLSHQG